jgi:beta-aspartyl-peptidase (threonine type)
MATPKMAVLLTLSLLWAISGNSYRAPQGAPPAKPQPQNETFAEEPQQIRQDVEQGVKHLLVSQVEAWNRGEIEGFMHGYWHSPELTFYSGATITKGWEPTLVRYRERYRGPGKEMGKLEFQDLDIDVLSPRAAVVTGKFKLTMSNGQQPHGLFTLVVKRTAGGWRVVHDHTSAAE